MVLNMLFLYGIEVGGNFLQILFRDGGIHQTTCRTADQLIAGIDNIQCNQYGNDRVNDQPAGNHHHHNTGDHAHRCIDIGHQMPAISLEQD